MLKMLHHFMLLISYGAVSDRLEDHIVHVRISVDCVGGVSLILQLILDVVGSEHRNHFESISFELTRGSKRDGTSEV